MALQPIMEVDPDACVNCHQCVSVCPIKYRMDGSGDSRPSTMTPVSAAETVLPPVDILDQAVAEKAAQQKRLLTSSMRDHRTSLKLDQTLTRRWRPDLYVRREKARSALTKRKTPSEQEMWGSITECLNSPMPMFSIAPPADTAAAREWPGAIHNGLNKPENCLH